MSTKLVRIVVWGSLAVAVVVVSYIRYTTTKRNQLIDEANALIDEGDAKHKELGPEGDQLIYGFIPKDFFVASPDNKTPPEDEVILGAIPRKGFAVDRAKLAKSVAKADDVLAKVVEDFRAAAAKFDAGRKIGKSSAFKIPGTQVGSLRKTRRR